MTDVVGSSELDGTEQPRSFGKQRPQELVNRISRQRKGALVDEWKVGLFFVQLGMPRRGSDERHGELLWITGTPQTIVNEMRTEMLNPPKGIKWMHDAILAGACVERAQDISYLVEKQNEDELLWTNGTSPGTRHRMNQKCCWGGDGVDNGEEEPLWTNDTSRSTVEKYMRRSVAGRWRFDPSQGRMQRVKIFFDKPFAEYYTVEGEKMEDELFADNNGTGKWGFEASGGQPPPHLPFSSRVHGLQNCELKQRQFFCTNCIRSHTRDFRVKTQHFAAERDEQVAKATKALGVVEAARMRRRARRRGAECARPAAEGQRQKQNATACARFASRSPPAAARLSAAALPASPSPAAATHPALGPRYTRCSSSRGFSRVARAGLVQELIDVFHVVEVGGRPPLGGKAGSQGEWTIGDLILPVPGDVRRYPPQHINAVLTHAVHFVGLLAWYLGVKLPFNVRWEGGKLGVGVPWIGPARSGWGRWTAHHPLHLSLSPAPPTASTPPAAAVAAPSPSASLSMSQSQLPEPTPAEESPQFTTALAMLLYNVLYLAHTQGLEIPLAQAGDVLSNLWAVCCAPELG
ncbi:UV radiation resistance protein and autophagy-related subunit 14-domain-containing protein, partial [Mycena sp. CBHHK59/15]